MSVIERDPEHRVEVRYCNEATTESTFLDTHFGEMQARDAFHDFVLQGRDNYKIWAKYPHVVEVQVHLLQAQDPISDRFTCPCKEQVQTG